MKLQKPVRNKRELDQFVSSVWIKYDLGFKETAFILFHAIRIEEKLIIAEYKTGFFDEDGNMFIHRGIRNE